MMPGDIYIHGRSVYLRLIESNRDVYLGNANKGWCTSTKKWSDEYPLECKVIGNIKDLIGPVKELITKNEEE